MSSLQARYFALLRLSIRREHFLELPDYLLRFLREPLHFIRNDACPTIIRLLSLASYKREGYARDFEAAVTIKVFFIARSRFNNIFGNPLNGRIYLKQTMNLIVMK